ncbi:MAG: Uma2 family endonuclease [Blastocatellia bacterium]
MNALVIRLGPLKRALTDDEFFEFCGVNRDLRIEMTKEGEMIIMMAVGSEGGHRNYLLTVRIGVWAEADGGGIGFDSSTGFTLPNGAKRSPDFAWILREKWEALPEKERKKFAPICPDFVVELRSETDNLKMVKEKMEEYIASGARLGWLIDPLEKKVHIYRLRARVKVLNRPKTISGEPLLKGLTLDLTGIVD